MSKFISLETERLLLKPTTEEDAEFVYALLNTPSWIKYIGQRNVHSVEDGRQYIINKMQPQLERLGYSNYTVVRKSDGTKLGSCGLYDREGLEGIDIGFAFFPAYEKKGYAFEAAQKIIEIATTQFNIKTIKAITTKDNFSSQKLLKKLGFNSAGTTKLPNDKEELLVYIYQLN